MPTSDNEKEDGREKARAHNQDRRKAHGHAQRPGPVSRREQGTRAVGAARENALLGGLGAAKPRGNVAARPRDAADARLATHRLDTPR